MPPSVGLVYSEEDAQHVLANREHTERPERTRTVWDKLEKSGLAEQCARVGARELTREETGDNFFQLLRDARDDLKDNSWWK